MGQYQVGAVFQLYEDDEQEYIIVYSVELEGILYLLASPVNNVGKISKMDAAKMFLLKVDKTNDEIDFENNEEVINKVVECALKNK